jgi:cobalt/nickel transport system permease protein
MFPLFAVHIAEEILNWPWRVAGAIITIAVVALASRRLRDEEIPRIALLTAAFFVASSIRVSLGPTSVHLVLNGLMGVILGFRAALAILSGLILQFSLMGHGGFTTLGVNFCVMALPALLARPLYQLIRSEESGCTFRWRDAAMAWFALLGFEFLCAFFVLRFLWRNLLGTQSRMTAVFRAGFFTGLVSVVLTVILNGVALVGGGVEDWRIFAAVVVVAHIPVALIEGVIVGFTTSFLEGVKPELLRPA